MPDAYGNMTEEESRRVGMAAPNMLAGQQAGWSGLIGGKRMYLGGLPSTATQAEAENYYRTNPATRSSIDRGFAAPSVFAAVNPNATPNELAAYGNTYKQRQNAINFSGDSMATKFKKAGKFKLWQTGNIFKQVADDPSRLFTGIDPLSTKAWNSVLGTDNKPIVGQLGGATENDFRRYEAINGPRSLGAARSLETVANATAGIAGAAGMANGLSNLFSPAAQGVPYHSTTNLNGSLSQVGGNVGGAVAPLEEIVVTGTTGGGLTGGQLAAMGGAAAGGAVLAGSGSSGATGGLTNSSSGGIFANNGTGGMADVGVGNAGTLANSGAITGGAGTMGWGEWINLAGQLGGSLLEGQGARRASNAESAALRAGIEEQRRQFDLNRADQMPWMQSGVAALGRLNDPNGFTASPSYEFVRGEGTRGIENSLAARGGAMSGNAMRRLSEFNTGLASQEFGNWWNQQSGLAGLGQTSTQSVGALGQNNTNNVSNLLGQQGNVRASGIAGQTNALTGGLSDFLSWYNRRNQGGG
jgi:hypothetical protein